MNPELAFFIKQRSAQLYPPEVWKPLEEQEARIGICTELYDLRCEVIDTCFEDDPELFDGIQWLNDDNGMPLWVRPGVNWIPDHELDDDDYEDPEP